MNVSIVTLFPALYEPFLRTSLIGRAQEAGVFNAHVANMLDFCAPKERPDAPTYGHGAGMVLRPELVQKIIEQQEAQFGSAYKIFFSPHGTKLTPTVLNSIAQVAQEKKHIMLLPARYEGMDARIEEAYADLIVSVGDFVLMGGDLPAMMLLEGFLRYVPGVVGRAESVACDSFTGPLVDYPEYTEPLVWKDKSVPEVLRSGNHKAIAQWRQQQAVERTVFGHFDWLRTFDVDEPLREAVHQVLPPHYVVLMHDRVKLKDGRVGTSSVTSIDVHDIARASRTYGLEGFFIVTPLKDQQHIVGTLLDFWLKEGQMYNLHRTEAIKTVAVSDTLDAALAAIEQRHGSKPLLIGTSAQEHGGANAITYHDQTLVWKHKRPVVLLLGTAFGLDDSSIARCDYVLPPVKGFSDFNHLSVRSAAAIVFDRWLGINKTR